jgi:hypothetical protein
MNGPWRFFPAVLGVLAAGGLVVLFLFDPATTHGLYPVCPLHETTGLLCPGCGTLRALHQLTHGNFAAAWGFNPFVVALLPVGFWLGLREMIWLATGRRLPGIVTKPLLGWILVAALVAFGVLRNVPAFRSHL